MAAFNKSNFFFSRQVLFIFVQKLVLEDSSILSELKNLVESVELSWVKKFLNYISQHKTLYLVSPSVVSLEEGWLDNKRSNPAINRNTRE